MSQYAANTSVSVERSRNEIERTLERYGADRQMYMSEDGRAAIVFEMNERRIRFILPLPDKFDPSFAFTPSRGHERSEAETLKHWEQACRQRWRALALCIKAKLEAVEAGIVEFEEEFLAHIVLPGGQTIGEEMIPQIDAAYGAKKMPLMLPGAKGK